MVCGGVAHLLVHSPTSGVLVRDAVTVPCEHPRERRDQLQQKKRKQKKTNNTHIQHLLPFDLVFRARHGMGVADLRGTGVGCDA